MTAPETHRWWCIEYTRHGIPLSSTGLHSLDAVRRHLQDVDRWGGEVTGIRECTSVTTFRDVDRAEVEAGS